MDKTQERVEALERQAERVQGCIERLGALSHRRKMDQITIFLVGFVLAIAALALNRIVGVLVVLVGMLAIAYVGKYQRKVDQSFIKHKTLLHLLTTQIARARLDWDAIPAIFRVGEREEHPFDLDLDITGDRSLHQLINTAVSYGGIERLREWLLCRTPDLDAIRRRQALVRELVPLTRFRNKLLLYSLFATRFTAEPLEGDRLAAALEAHRGTKQRLSTLIVATVLAVLLYSSVLLFIYAQFSPLFFVGMVVLSLGWFLATRREQGNVSEDASYLQLTLGQLKDIFEYLETYPYAQHSQLKTLCEPFFAHGDRSPSFSLEKIRKIMSRARMAANTTNWIVLNMFFPVGAYTAYQLDRYKDQLAEYLPRWLDTWYELEALCSLANFAYLNPEYVLPRVAPQKKGEPPVLFQATALGHPLIPKEKKVTNDLQIGHLGDILMITGSNMAGKSTFLRTIGINLCLAYTGTVVNAAMLQTELFELYACIKVTDSLADGYSYFYAEVRRLKGLLVELEQEQRYPLFFLIDEIFRGTNNDERRIGSEAYIRALIGRSCVGAISTHDLELAKLANLFPEITNVHFREEVRDGQMVFDYLLRPGPSPTRNALRIMQMEGLPVRWDETPPLSARRSPGEAPRPSRP